MSKHYDEDFKLNALKYRKDNPHLTVRALARSLGISAPIFYKWQKAAKQNDGDVLHRGSGYFDSDEAKEIARLKIELKNSYEALLILKSNGYSGKRRTEVIYECVNELSNRVSIKGVLPKSNVSKSCYYVRV